MSDCDEAVKRALEEDRDRRWREGDQIRAQLVFTLIGAGVMVWLFEWLQPDGFLAVAIIVVVVAAIGAASVWYHGKMNPR